MCKELENNYTSRGVRNFPFQRGDHDGAGGAEIMAGFGVAVAAAEISGLIGDHHFFFAHGSHVDGLIGGEIGGPTHVGLDGPASIS